MPEPIPSLGISAELRAEIMKRLPKDREVTDEDFVIAAGRTLIESPWAFDPFNSNDAVLRALVNVDQSGKF